MTGEKTMSVDLTTITGAMQRRLIGNYPAASDALKAIPGMILSAEEDADHPGCWDVAAARGGALDIYCIEPAGRV